MSSTGWNCKLSSSEHKYSGYSSDRFTCSYTNNNGASYGGFVSSDSHHGGPSKGGEGYGAGVSVGFSFK